MLASGPPTNEILSLASKEGAKTPPSQINSQLLLSSMMIRMQAAPWDLIPPVICALEEVRQDQCSHRAPKRAFLGQVPVSTTQCSCRHFP